MPITMTTDATFAADVLASSMPILVDFTGEWCGPCRMVTPVLEKIAADEADRVRLVSLDVDANPVTTIKYEVLGMPTFALFKNGEMVARFLGAKPRAAIMRRARTAPGAA